ncbi:protein transport protein Sec24B, putative [Plasmodium malariae]|uniref:Protein transport protein Sec24B, putative n=1 Tax=Plasmodium malariae TaxID=5858 RepID=A0A1D3JIA8_PLAMA|nr:protein transport protein Sec24B, putative [Plasmodium malariae]SBT86200.1 protein transport protein Sec24B, putative [Plasmodium malariae]
MIPKKNESVYRGNTAYKMNNNNMEDKLNNDNSEVIHNVGNHDALVGSNNTYMSEPKNDCNPFSTHSCERNYKGENVLAGKSERKSELTGVDEKTKVIVDVHGNYLTAHCNHYNNFENRNINNKDICNASNIENINKNVKNYEKNTYDVLNNSININEQQPSAKMGDSTYTYGYNMENVRTQNFSEVGVNNDNIDISSMYHQRMKSNTNNELIVNRKNDSFNTLFNNTPHNVDYNKNNNSLSEINATSFRNSNNMYSANNLHNKGINMINYSLTGSSNVNIEHDRNSIPLYDQNNQQMNTYNEGEKSYSDFCTNATTSSNAVSNTDSNTFNSGVNNVVNNTFNTVSNANTLLGKANNFSYNTMQNNLNYLKREIVKNEQINVKSTDNGYYQMYGNTQNISNHVPSYSMPTNNLNDQVATNKSNQMQYSMNNQVYNTNPSNWDPNSNNSFSYNQGFNSSSTVYSVQNNVAHGSTNNQAISNANNTLNYYRYNNQENGISEHTAYNYQHNNTNSAFINRPFTNVEYGSNTRDKKVEDREEKEEKEANKSCYGKSNDESLESSSDENSSDNENSVTDKGEEIYTLLKKTYNRIDINKIPRPIINFQDKKSKRNLKLFETCKYISPPSYYQPYISIDTGKADPRFVKSTLYQIPLFSETLKLSRIPFGIIVNPFACLNEGEYIDKIDMKDIVNDKEENIEILRCPKCYCYLHATILEDISKSLQCVFCDTKFLINENVLFDIYQYNEKINNRENENNGGISPLLKGSVDIIIPPTYYYNNINNLKLTYTYINKNMNQTASMITNKIMSITKQISNTLVPSDAKGCNKQTVDLYGHPSDVNNNMDKISGVVLNNYSDNLPSQSNDRMMLSFNFSLNELKNIILEKKGEPDEYKLKRNAILLKYPQIKNTLPPYFVFVVECSYNAIYSNITYTVLEGIRYAVQNVKCNKTKIAIITFNSSIHFYNCKRGGNGNSATNCVNTNCATSAAYGTTNDIVTDSTSNINSSSQVIMMSDVDDPFLPLPLDDLFFGCVDELDKINNLIDTIKYVTTTMQSYGSCGNSALKVAVDILKERHGLGSICMFYTSTPNCGIGAIKELKKDINDNFLEVKQKIFYDALLLDLYSYNISVDIFIISSNKVRVCVPSLQYVAQNTGGKILFLDNFVWQKDYKELYMNIRDTLTSEDIAYCCELKLRYSQNMSVKKLFCCNNNFNSIISVDTIKIPKIRHDQTFAFLLSYSDISETKKQVYIQCACIYTNLNGDRYVRLHTTHMNLTTSLSTVFRYTDAEALMNILIKQLCTNILHNDNYSKIIIDSLAAILFSYRVNVLLNTPKRADCAIYANKYICALCASSAHSGQLILPDTLKLLPLFTSSLLKHNVVKKDILHDIKVYSLIKLLSMPIISSLLYVYPITYLIHIKGKTNEIDTMNIDDELFIPRTIPSSAEKIYSNGIYLLDSCTHFYLYFGFHADSDFTIDIVGEIPTEQNCLELNLTDNINAKKIQRIIMNLTRIHHFNKYVPLVVVPPKSSNEHHIMSLCVEDKVDKEYSYVNFLCFIHKLVHKKIDES